MVYSDPCTHALLVTQQLSKYFQCISSKNRFPYVNRLLYKLGLSNSNWALLYFKVEQCSTCLYISLLSQNSFTWTLKFTPYKTCSSLKDNSNNNMLYNTPIQIATCWMLKMDTWPRRHQPHGMKSYHYKIWPTLLQLTWGYIPHNWSILLIKVFIFKWSLQRGILK